MNKNKKYFELFGGGDKPQWSVLKHNGPMFPPNYIPHKTEILVKGKRTALHPQAEEYATMFAKYLGTDYMKISNFKKNFWKDFKPTVIYLGVNSLDDFDFSNYKKYLEREKAKRDLLTKEDKERIKNQNDKEAEPFKNCIIDGVQQKIGNFKIEPPGIFIGRGTHPKLGRIKRRIRPEDVTLNFLELWKSAISDLHTIIILAEGVKLNPEKIPNWLECIVYERSDIAKFLGADSHLIPAKGYQIRTFGNLISDRKIIFTIDPKVIPTLDENNKNRYKEKIASEVDASSFIIKNQ
jgi:hypothetical protein